MIFLLLSCRDLEASPISLQSKLPDMQCNYPLCESRPVKLGAIVSLSSSLLQALSHFQWIQGCQFSSGAQWHGSWIWPREEWASVRSKDVAAVRIRPVSTMCSKKLELCKHMRCAVNEIGRRELSEKDVGTIVSV